MPVQEFWKKVAIACLIVALNFFVLETFTRLLAIQAKPTEVKTPTFDRKYQLARKRADNPPEVVLLGDSIMNHGIYPEYLDAQINGQGFDSFNSVNLASPGATPQMNLLMLKEYVEINGKPKLLVYNFSPRNFNRNHVVDVYQEQFDTSYLKRCEGRPRKTIWRSIACFAERNVAVLHYRSFLRDEVDKLPKTLFDFRDRLAFDETANPEWQVSEKGWAPAYAIQTPRNLKDKFADNDEIREVFTRELGNYQWTTRDVAPILRFCRSHGIPVLFVWLPEHEMMNPYYAGVGISHGWLAGKMTQQAKRDGFHFQDFAAMRLPVSAFSDLDHLNAKGALAVTERMAALLAKEPFDGILRKAER